MISYYDHFCDYQIKRFIMQLVRAFSGFQYMTGRRGDIDPQLRIVPCTTAMRNRQVAAIKKNLSENTLNTVPMITIDHNSFEFNVERLQNPNHVATVQVYERARDPVTGLYTNALGNSITVERLMPLPFTMGVTVDIWTSNMDQKHQLMEQILTMIYPTFSIQNSDNPIDWTALTDVHCKDITWSSVSLPIGNDDAIDIASITLEVPIWLTPPAKVKRMKVIEQIITNINDGEYDNEGNLINGERMATQVTTFGDHQIEITRGVIKLLGSHANELDPEGHIFSWRELLDRHSHQFIPAQTQLRIRYSLDDGSPEIVGRLQYGDTNNLLEWQIDVDTLPANTIPAVDAVIDPTRNFPGGDLPTAAEGQRYLLINDLPGSTLEWGHVGARVNSILQYSNGEWTIDFNGQPNNRVDYVLNQTTSRQLRWDGQDWTVAIDGTYSPGFWRIV